jgi:hypothetical protein
MLKRLAGKKNIGRVKHEHKMMIYKKERRTHVDILFLDRIQLATRIRWILYIMRNTIKIRPVLEYGIFAWVDAPSSLASWLARIVATASSST